MTTLPPRLASLDAFRGLAIAGMVLVNNPGDWGALYPPLAHAAWHGWTFTDTIFPFFLFIVGVSMTISLHTRSAVGAGRAALGWLLGLMAIYSVAMLAVPVPDVQGVVAAGALEPGRDFGAWLDRQLLRGHLWSVSRTWDPEGITSTLPAVGTLLAGVLAGRWLATATPPAEKTVWQLLAGLALLGLGTLLDDWLMPINKNLWTPSYAVFMAGWALLVFGAFHWLLDAAPSASLRRAMGRLAQPLVIYGMNALFIFAFSGLVARLMGIFRLADGRSLKQALYAPLQALPLAPVQASLLWALAFNLVMFGVAWAMWRRRWFIKA